MRWTVSLTVVPVMVLSSFTMMGRAADLPGIPPETVTDYIHAVIEADRTFYTIHVVEHMQRQGGAPAAENWRAKKKTLPLPAQFLAEASDLASKTGTKVRYRLISLWPIIRRMARRMSQKRRGSTLCVNIQNNLPPVRSSSTIRPISGPSTQTALSAKPALAATIPIRAVRRRTLSG